MRSGQRSGKELHICVVSIGRHGDFGMHDAIHEPKKAEECKTNGHVSGPKGYSNRLQTTLPRDLEEVYGADKRVGREFKRKRRRDKKKENGALLDFARIA